MSAEPILSASGVHRSFGGVRAVDVDELHVERGAVDLQDLRVRQWLVAPARHARSHRSHVLGERRGAEGVAGGAAAAAARGL